MGVTKQHRFVRELIDVRRLHGTFVTAEAAHPVLHVVNREKQNVEGAFDRWNGLAMDFRFLVA